MSSKLSRRLFIQHSVVAGLAVASLPSCLSSRSRKHVEGMKMGLVTYQWGKDWDLPTLLANCQKTGFQGVELRTQHAHKVEANLSPTQRNEVKKMFIDSGVTCIGYGSNFEYHSPEQTQLRENIEQTKAYIRLCHDIGASGIKVKPNSLLDDVPKEKTIAQIAMSLNEVGRYAKDYGQLIRVEVHGRLTAEIPNMKAIFDQVTEPNVKICWNSNPQDLMPPGLEGNFNMVKRWLGDTVHVHDLDTKEYPYQKLFNLFEDMHYNGWLLLEEHREVDDKLAGMIEQLKLFNQMVAKAKMRS